jgi:DNA-directed RNA polymerase specialized sigma24 family protein
VDGNDDDEKRRRAILADPTVHKEMRKVLRKRGVPVDEVKDVLHDVIADVAANLSKLPLNQEEASLYLCGAARLQAIDHGNARTKELERRVDLEDAHLLTRSPAPEDALQARRLDAHARKLFPVEYLWFLRHKLLGESHAEIAQSAGRSPETVRQRIREVGRALARNGAKFGLVLLVLVVLFFNVRHWLRILGGMHDPRGMEANTATPSAVPPPVPPPPVRPENDPALLRARGRGECENGQWDFCVLDLARANELDRAGETRELGQLLDRALDKMDEEEAKPGLGGPRRTTHSPHYHVPGSQVGNGDAGGAGAREERR